MAVHKLWLFLILLSVTQYNFAQKKVKSEDPAPKLMLQNRNWVKSSPTIKANDLLSIKIHGQDKVIRGYYTSFTDSTIQLNDKTIAFNEIEEMRISDPIGLGIGALTLSAATVIAVYGLFIVSQIDDVDGLGVDLFLTLTGGAIISVGALTGLIGTIVVTSCTHVYKMEKWKFYVSYP
jgi:hypothetical protein